MAGGYGANQYKQMQVKTANRGQILIMLYEAAIQNVKKAAAAMKAAAAGKRHGMIKRTKKFIQKARGTMVLTDSDAKIVKKYMPYAR